MARSRHSTDVTVTRVQADETYVRVNSVGEGGIRPFVLVPGIGVSSTYFERLAPNLNEFGPVHALDLPGFGGVPHPKHTLSIEGYAELVGRAIDELGLENPVIVGHSMGSQVVTELLAQRPEFTTAVLIGPVVHPTERRIPTQAIRFLQAAWHEPFTVKVLATSNYLLCGPKWFSRVLPKMMAFPIEERLPEVRAHTLVIRGEFDSVAPRDWVEQVGELLPSSRLWEIPGAAHSVMYAHADEVARLCVEHARETLAEPDDDELHVLADADADGDDPQMTVEDAAQIVAGRVTETIGVLRGDDEAIAEGKSTTAEAIERTQS
jgi:pimeloyl-ACP methyl ester carboxylesterase